MRRLSILGLVALFFGCQAEPEDPLATEAEAIRARLATSEGGQLVLRAIDAGGGIHAWLEAPSSSYTWDFGSDGFLVKSHLVANNRTRQIYHDLTAIGSRVEPVALNAQMAWDGKSAWIYPNTVQVNPRFWASTAYYFQSIPFVLADPGIRYEVLADDSLDGTVHHLTKVSYDDSVGDSYGDTYTLYVHPETGRLSAIRYSATFGRGRPAPGEVRETLMYYLDYETIDGLTVPTRFESYSFADGRKGALRATALASNISFREPFDEGRLTMPEGGRVQPFE